MSAKEKKYMLFPLPFISFKIIFPSLNQTENLIKIPPHFSSYSHIKKSHLTWYII